MPGSPIVQGYGPVRPTENTAITRRRGQPRAAKVEVKTSLQRRIMREGRDSGALCRREGRKTMPYERPELTALGSIVDHTFATPHGNVKGCEVDCHLDSFTEQSANPTS